MSATVISIERDGAFVDVVIPRGLGNIVIRVTLNEAIELHDKLRAMLYPIPVEMAEEPDA